MKNFYFVVSNHYSQFATQNPGVYTYDQYISLLSENTSNTEPKTFLVGQGFSEQMRDLLEKETKKLAPDWKLINPFSPPSEKKLVHKHKEENVLISKPICTRPLHYSAHLVIDDRCIDLGDHQTGQHIQGMVLLEATRQFMIACSELLLECSTFRIAALMEEIQIKYHRHAFPLSLTMECIFHKEPVLTKTRSSIETTVNCYQLEQLVCTTQAKVAFAKEKLVHYVESTQAYEALNKYRLSSTKIEKTSYTRTKKVVNHR